MGSIDRSFIYALAPGPDCLSAAGFGDVAAAGLSGSANADFHSGDYSGPDGYADSGTYGHAVAHANPDSGADADAAADRHAEPDAYSHAATDGYPNPNSDANANSHPHANTYTYPDANAGADTHANPGAYRHAAANGYPNPNADGHAAADTDTYPDTFSGRMDYLPRPRRLQH